MWARMMIHLLLMMITLFFTMHINLFLSHIPLGRAIALHLSQWYDSSVFFRIVVIISKQGNRGWTS